MSDKAVVGLRRDLIELRDEVHALRGTLNLIHEAVVNMSGKVYVPGPPPQSSGPT